MGGKVDLNDFKNLCENVVWKQDLEEFRTDFDKIKEKAENDISQINQRVSNNVNESYDSDDSAGDRKRKGSDGQAPLDFNSKYDVKIDPGEEVVDYQEQVKMKRKLEQAINKFMRLLRTQLKNGKYAQFRFKINPSDFGVNGVNQAG